jgi:FtsZ-interacting cell division protein ZipA
VDATTFRWVLIIIALLLGVAIYFYSTHQSRLRKRSAIETFTREEIDSAFIEDEQLRDELNNLNQILNDNESIDEMDKIEINPAGEIQSTPFALPDPDIFIPKLILKSPADRFVSHMLRHDDFRLIIGEEADNAIKQTELDVNDEGYLVDPNQDRETFQIASLSAPGHFLEVEQLEFATLGFNCFIDLESCEDPGQAYEGMLKKIDELVRLLNVKVFKPGQELLTISDVTSVREKLA